MHICVTSTPVDIENTKNGDVTKWFIYIKTRPMSPSTPCLLLKLKSKKAKKINDLIHFQILPTRDGPLTYTSADQIVFLS